MKQSDLARTLLTSPQSISKWERGENDPDIIHLPVLARILGVSVDWLLAVELLAPSQQGSIVFIGVTTARLRGSQLTPPAFAAWCQGILSRSVAQVQACGGEAITSHGPGLLAAFTGSSHLRCAWQAIQACCQLHEVPLKIGHAAGAFHRGELQLGAQRRSPDVFGEPVTVALLLADWTARTAAGGTAVRHGVAWRGERSTRSPAPHAQHQRLVIEQQVVTDISSWHISPGAPGR